MPSLQRFNELPLEEARALLLRVCGSRRWVDEMLSARPFTGIPDLFESADRIWEALDKTDRLEAFAAHPRIGDVESIKKKFASTADWASAEQAGVRNADTRLLEELAEKNRDYETRFGYIFIVCATGLGADAMLSRLRERLGNAPEDELRIAAREQAKITRIRLEKMLNS